MAGTPEGIFNVKRLQESLQSIQESLDCAVVSEEASFPGMLVSLSRLSANALDETQSILESLLSDRVYRIHNMRAPINRLPSEVFRPIFLYLKDYNMPLSTAQLQVDVWKHPFLVSWHRTSGVCRRWRQEMLRTQSIWMTVRVSDIDTLSLTAAWLTRSGTPPLTIISKTHSHDDLRFSGHGPRKDHVPKISCSRAWLLLSDTVAVPQAHITPFRPAGDVDGHGEQRTTRFYVLLTSSAAHAVDDLWHLMGVGVIRA